MVDPITISITISVIALTFSILTFEITRRVTIRQLKAATYTAIMGRLHEINRLELEHPELFEQLHKAFDKTELQRDARLKHYLFMLFNLWAEIHAQYKKFGFFDDEEMYIWTRRVENDFHRRPFLRGYWKLETKTYPYTQTYMDFINKALERVEADIAQESRR